MKNLEQLISKYLKEANVMQLATSVENRPWACNVHFYADEDFNLYWCSTLERRHSQEIKQNQNVAVAIVVHENTPSEKYIIGISMEGAAELIGENIDESIGEAYVKKLDKHPNLLPDIIAGKNPHKFYCLKPSKIVLFDTKAFPDSPRQEWKLA